MTDKPIDIQGTPMEIEQKEVDMLRQLKTVPGYKVLLRMIHLEQSKLLSEHVAKQDYSLEALIQNKVAMQTWDSIIALIDCKIASYDEWLIRTLDLQKKQREEYNRYETVQRSYK